MGSVTEQEAREAVVKLRNALELASELNPDDHDESERDIKREFEKHETTLIRFAKQELDRRDAERAERAKPIDAEWLESLGAVRENNPAGGHWQWSIGLVRIAKLRGGWQWWIGMFHGEQLVKAETREDILRLIEALKGGAT